MQGNLRIAGATEVFEETVAVSGRILFDIGGTRPGIDHDVVNVSGNFEGGGELSLTLAPGFDPPVGTSFTILNYGNLGLPFGIVRSFTTPSNNFLRVEYQSNLTGGGSIVVTVTPSRRSSISVPRRPSTSTVSPRASTSAASSPVAGRTPRSPFRRTTRRRTAWSPCW